MSQMTELEQLADELRLWIALRKDQGEDVSGLLAETRQTLRAAVHELSRPRSKTPPGEPEDLKAIQAQRPHGPRDLRGRLDAARLDDQLLGAWLGRAAGCTLGVPVENWSIAEMERLARLHGVAFPPDNYWPGHPWPDTPRYGKSVMGGYLRGNVRHVPVDDDLAYTVLGLLILEEYGPDFTTDDVAAAWLKYLPMACTAEHVTLENLRRGVSSGRAGAVNNPYQEWIGADIRSDPWGYACAGWPEQAAALALRDARLSHRRTGIYGAMYFAAAIAAAFAVDSPMEALRLGLSEVPKNSRFARAIRWALRTAPALKDWREARAAVDERYGGLHPVHTSNNACLTVFGLFLGDGDFTRTIGITVAMGLDNDCTAATAGSILGAIQGKNGIPEHWWKPFRNRTRTYLNDHEWWRNSDIAARFRRLHGIICA